MHILLVSATKKEIEAILREMKEEQHILASRLTRYTYLNHSVDVLISGVGMVATAFWMGKILSDGNYDFVINCGLAGSFNNSLSLGEVVNVTEDYFIEMGAENESNFISLSELGLLESSDFPNSAKGIVSTYDFENPALTVVKKVNGITVNKVHGDTASIHRDMALYHSVHGKPPITESMEGAAFLFSCINDKIPCIQLRAISNYVEKRNTANWKVDLALKNLSAKVIEVMQAYADEN
jgi:futalosine hydrolase